MSNAPISREALELSRRRHEASIGSDWRYMQFFNFLQFSPSYRLAHLVATARVDRNTTVVPADFATVEGTYRAFGPLMRTYFWEWWVKTAQYQFGVSVKPEPRRLLKLDLYQAATDSDIGSAQDALADYLRVDRLAQSNPATFVVALPIHGDRKSLLRAFATLLDQTYGTADKPEGVASYSVIRNKIRKGTVDMARRVFLARAHSPKKRLFAIGNFVGVSPVNRTDELKPRAEERDRRRIMEIMTSRHLHRAYLIAENAARGRFPCLDPLPNDPKRPEFDFPMLNRQYRSYIRWMETELAATRVIYERQQARAAKKTQ